jgi:hypothetical protein
MVFVKTKSGSYLNAAFLIEVYSDPFEESGWVVAKYFDSSKGQAGVAVISTSECEKLGFSFGE